MRRTLIVAYCILATVNVPVTAAVPNAETRSSTPTANSTLRPVPPASQRFAAYSPAFAKRFGLDVREATDLDSRMEAIEIGIDIDPASKAPVCYVAIYLVSRLVDNEILGQEASAHVLESDRHFFLRPRKDGREPRELFSAGDASHLLSRQARYFRQLGFTTVDYSARSKGAARVSAAIAEEASDLFPGINYVRSRGCMPLQMILHGVGIEVALKRRGAPDYTRIVGPWRDEDFIRIPVPKSLYEAAAPAIKAYEKYIDELTEEQARKRRNALKGRTN